jgi:hypothetical protein
MSEVLFQTLVEKMGQFEKEIQELKNKVDGFDKKLSGIKVTAPPVDTLPIKTLIETGINTMKKVVENQPKSVIRQVRLLFFPDVDTAKYYRIVFGRLIFWMVIILALLFLFALGQEWIERPSSVSEKRFEMPRYNKVQEYHPAPRSKKPSKEKKNTSLTN